MTKLEKIIIEILILYLKKKFKLNIYSIDQLFGPIFYNTNKKKKKYIC